ncbi:hypothetical protein LPJ73_000007 [Coemansia sp. RSA 2703]|nr:hypothetical protein LPJ73_000007 [Coemansia sp. RSA 2703]
MSSTSASCIFKLEPTKARKCTDFTFAIGRLANVERHLVFLRKDPFWIIPHYAGQHLETNDMDIVFILAELSTGAYVALMPFTQNQSIDFTPVLRSSDTGTLSVHSSQVAPLSTVRIAATINTRPYEAVRELFNRVQQSLTPRHTVNIPSTSQKTSALHNVALDAHLGYCTWNAFYQQVSHSKIISAVRDIFQIGVSSGQPQPAWVVIDDGWQSVNRYDGFGQLYDKCANKEKFPGQLRQTVAELKALGISRVGVWHALWGYWGGIDPEGQLAKRYSVQRYHCQWSPVADECDVWLIAPEGIAHFYDEFYGWLQSEGVSFVKVDYQAAFETLEGYGQDISISTMYNAYIDAMESAALKHFGPASIIHCMAQSPQLITRSLQSKQQEQTEYPPLQRCLFRNSDDYFPNVPSSHGWHIQCNLANSVWSRCLGAHLIADWDMFKPGKKESDIHAASRLLGGGPVYITGGLSDYQNQELSRYVGTSGMFAERNTQFLDHNMLFSDMTKVPGVLAASAAATNAEAVLITVYNINSNDLVSSISLSRLYENIMLETNDTSSSASSVMFSIFQHSTKRTAVTSLIPTASTIALKSFGCDMFSITRMSALRSSDRSAVLYAACLGDTSSYASSSVVDRSVYGVLPRPSSIGSSSSLGSICTPPASPCIYAVRSWNVRARITCQPSSVSFVFHACDTLANSHTLPLTISSVRISGYEVSSDRWHFNESTGVLTITTDWSAEPPTASTQPNASPTNMPAYITVNVTA